MRYLFIFLLVWVLAYNLNGQIYRGININAVLFNNVNNPNINMLNATGADVIRLSFGFTPLINKTAPYDYNLTVFGYLENALNFCEDHHIKVIIDPHTIPGTASNSTMDPTDLFWTDLSLQSHIYRLWDTLSLITRDRGDVIYGLDLMNEPALPCCDVNVWNEMADSLTTIIRDNDNNHTIIIEPFGYINNNGQYISRINAMPLLVLPEDDNLIVSPHFYVPNAFTHQGVGSNPTGVVYPGVINGVNYDISVLEDRMRPIVDFQDQHPGMRILMGEFSSSRAGGAPSDVWINDVITLIEAQGWDWTYHEFRGSSVWDAEMPLGSNTAMPRDTNQPRMQLLMDYFRLEDVVLPLDIISFEGHQTDGCNQLSWIFADNLNSIKSLVLEKQSVNKDFVGIKTLAASQLEPNKKVQYNDCNVHKESTYRLKVVTNDENVYFSNYVTLKALGSDLKVYPTIIQNELVINSDRSQLSEGQIYNLDGELLKKIQIHNGVNTIDVNDLPPGVFVLRVDTENIKLIKINN